MKIQVFRLFELLFVIGEMLSSILPVELLERLNLTIADFEKANDEYISRVVNI